MKKSILNMTQFETRVSDCFSMIHLMKMTSGDANAHIAKTVLSELNRQYANKRYVYTQYERGFVNGLIRAGNTAIWRAVEFVYIVDGVLYSTAKTSVHRSTNEFYDSGRGSLLANAPSGHVWIGTDKPYTEIKLPGY